jgi:hypothetical protein
LTGRDSGAAFACAIPREMELRMALEQPNEFMARLRSGFTLNAVVTGEHTLSFGLQYLNAD